MEEANDLLQDLFVRLHEKIKDYRFEAPFAAWLYRLAVNLCQDRLRARTRKNRFLTGWYHEDLDARDADTAILATERDKSVRAALAQIDPRYRVCLVLKEIEDCSYEQIAAILKVSVGTVRSRLNRGREQLRKLLLHEI
jgi:RNA polymerase sigma-70 factor (ECF subfamily)